MSIQGSLFTGQPANSAAIVTNDNTPLANPTRFIYVGGAGNVTVIDINGNTTTFNAVPVGTVLPIQAAIVKATGTTATLLVALW